ncbi:hypothetical protein D9M71_556220 [compost metagenome]
MKAQEQRIESLLQKAEALKRISVGFVSDAESEEQTRQRMLELAEEWRKYMQVQVTLVPPDTSKLKQAGDMVDGASGASAPSFATGGIVRGPGSGTSDSIWARISNGEGILTAKAVQHYGAGLVHQINRLQLPGFAGGGVVGERFVPSVPAFDPSLSAPAQQAGGGNTVVLQLPGGNTYTLQADKPTYDAIVHNESRKHGRK